MGRFRGFTIVELVVVVSLLVLLLALLLPSLQQARQVSRTAACQSNQHQLVAANQVYASAFHGFFVPIHPQPDGTPLWFWNETYMQMLGTWPEFPTLLPGLSCPDAPTGPPPKRTGWHHGKFANIYGWNWTTLKRNRHTTIQMQRIQRPAQAVQLVDGTDWHITAIYADYLTRWDVYGEQRLWSVAYRHQDARGCVITHFDGHSAYYTKPQTYSADAEVTRRLWNVY